MEIIAALLVDKPLHILIIAFIFLVLYLALEKATGKTTGHFRPVLILSLAWTLYAAWEWLVQVRTPEANIRVDLLIIWPVLAVLAGWAVYKTLRR